MTQQFRVFDTWASAGRPTGPISVNRGVVAYAKPDASGTLLVLTTGHKFRVQQAFAAVSEWLEGRPSDGGSQNE